MRNQTGGRPIARPSTLGALGARPINHAAPRRTLAERFADRGLVPIMTEWERGTARARFVLCAVELRESLSGDGSLWVYLHGGPTGFESFELAHHDPTEGWNANAGGGGWPSCYIAADVLTRAVDALRAMQTT